MSNITQIGGISLPVSATAMEHLDADGNPIAVSEEKPLPVSMGDLSAPHDCDRVEFSPDQETCTLMTFKKGGAAIKAFYLQRNESGKVIAIGID